MAENDEREIQRRIAQRLAALVPDGADTWETAPAYVRRHLAGHAAAGGTLPDLLRDLGFVGAADQTRLIPNLIALTDDRWPEVAATARAYLRLGSVRVGETFTQRIANVSADALVHGTPLDASIAVLAERLPWRARFADGRSPEAEFTAQTETYDLTALAIASLGAINVTVTADAYRRIQVWDAKNRSVSRTWAAHVAAIHGLAVLGSETEFRIVSVSEDETIAVWDGATGDLEIRITCPSPVRAVTVFRQPSGVRCATGHADGRVRVYNLETAECEYTYEAHSDAVSAITHVFDNTGPLLVSGSWDRSLVVHQFATGTTLAHATGPSGSLLDLAAATIDGRHVAAAAYADESVWVWELPTGRKLRQLTGHSAGVSSVALAQSGTQTLLASGGSDTIIQIWNVETGDHLATLSGHEAGVRAVAFQPTAGAEPILESIAADRSLRTWVLDGDRTGESKNDRFKVRFTVKGTPPRHIATRIYGSSAPIRAVTSLPNDAHAIVAAGSLDNHIQLFDEVGEPVRRWDAHDGGVLALCSFAIGSAGLLASTGRDGSVRVWDASSGELLRAWARQQSVWGVTSAVISGRTTVIAGGRDQTVHIYDVERGETLATLAGPSERIWGVDCAQIDGRLVIAAGCTDRTVWLWDAETSEPLRQLRGHRRGVRYVAFTHEDDVQQVSIIASSADGTVLRWDPSDPRPTERYDGHSDAVWGIAACQHQGRMIAASASEDMSVRLWDIESAASVPIPLSSPAYAVALDEGSLYIGSSTDLICLDLGERLNDEILGVSEL